MADLVARLELLKKEIEQTKSKTISLKANADREEEILRDLVKEIKDLGFNPKTLKEDIEKMEKDIEVKLLEKEKELSSVKDVISNIERNLKTHEIS